MPKRKPKCDPLWTVRDLMVRYKCKAAFVHDLIEDHGLPAVELPGRLRDAYRFWPNAVTKWERFHMDNSINAVNVPNFFTSEEATDPLAEAE